MCITTKTRSTMCAVQVCQWALSAEIPDPHCSHRAHSYIGPENLNVQEAWPQRWYVHNIGASRGLGHVASNMPHETRTQPSSHPLRPITPDTKHKPHAMCD